MSPMPRSRRNLGLPDNVRVRDGYYSWRHPITKKEWGLGRDKAKAGLAQKRCPTCSLFRFPQEMTSATTCTSCNTTPKEQQR